MSKYTINGKDYSIHDINVACAELFGIEFCEAAITSNGSVVININTGEYYNPCNNPSDTDAIIDKIFDELNKPYWIGHFLASHWVHITKKHNCSKLVAACICLLNVMGVSDECKNN